MGSVYFEGNAFIDGGAIRNVEATNSSISNCKITKSSLDMMDDSGNLQNITSVKDPVLLQDAATKKYVDDLGILIQNITLTGTQIVQILAKTVGSFIITITPIDTIGPSVVFNITKNDATKTAHIVRVAAAPGLTYNNNIPYTMLDVTWPANGNISLSKTTTHFDGLYKVKISAVTTDSNNNVIGGVGGGVSGGGGGGGGESYWAITSGSAIYYTSGNVVVNQLNSTSLVSTGSLYLSGTIYKNGQEFIGGGSNSWTTTTGNSIYYTSGSVIANTFTGTNLLVTNLSTGIVNANTYSGGSMQLAGNINVGSINFTGNLLQNGSTFVSSEWTKVGNDLAYTSGNVSIGNIRSTSISTSTINASTYSGGSMQLGGNITVGSINFTGSLLQNGSTFVSSEWVKSNGTNDISYTNGSVSIGNLYTGPISTGNLYVTGTIYKNGAEFIGGGGGSGTSQWTTTTGNAIYYTTGNVISSTLELNDSLKLVGSTVLKKTVDLSDGIFVTKNVGLSSTINSFTNMELSDNGSKILGVNNTSQFYISSNYGEFFTTKIIDGSGNIILCSTTDNFTKHIVCSATRIYLSTDSGNTYNLIYTIPNGTFTAIHINKGGTYIAAAYNEPGTEGIFIESTDSGGTFSSPSTIENYAAQIRFIKYVVSGGVESLIVQYFYFIPSDGFNIFAYRKRTAGIWSNSVNVWNDFFYDILAMSDNGEYALTNEYYGLRKVYDFGASVVVVTSPVFTEVPTYRSYMNGSGKYQISTRAGKWFYSSDFGITWTLGGTRDDFSGYAAISRDGSTLYMKKSNTEYAIYNNTEVSGESSYNTVLNISNIGIRITNPNYDLQLANDSAAKPSSTTWTVASDERLKTNITMANLDTCYNIVKSLPLKRYTWRDDIYTEKQVSDRSKLGWIAQDVETVFPKAVTYKNQFELEDCRDLNTDQLIATMYGTIQKLIQKIEILENQQT